MPEKFIENLDLLCCPSCNGELNFINDALNCTDCKKKYEIIGEIPVLIENSGNQMDQKQ